MSSTEKVASTRYWRISPGGGGWLWREQKLNECIAIGWLDDEDVTGMSEKSVRSKMHRSGETEQSCKQFADFRYNVRPGDKVVASSSSKGIYALGTVIGDYEFNEELWYQHSRKVRWETTFWHPVEIGSLKLPPSFRYKFDGIQSHTIRELKQDEWDCLCKRLNRVDTPFRNLGTWGGLVQSPEYENEVIILFSQMQQHLHMRIVSFGTRFPDAIVQRKKYGKWKKVNVEFERLSSGFQDHLKKYKKEDCHTIICWEDDDDGWDDRRVKRHFEIIELKKELEKIL